MGHTFEVIDKKGLLTGEDLTPMAEQCLAVYSHYVLNSAATFEEEVPTVAEFRQRMRKAYVWINARDGAGGAIVGYAYCGPFRERSAYRYVSELSVYLHPQCVGKGVGRALMDQLLAHMDGMGLWYAFAAVGGDNTASFRLHERMGFAKINVPAAGAASDGTPSLLALPIGYKLGKWQQVTWYIKPLKAAAVGSEGHSRGGDLSVHAPPELHLPKL